ncbi:unnamed protein product [Dicrocoelium dendriticum]|nr:unnamed protein product [Dicrocoelium dendriticum]
MFQRGINTSLLFLLFNSIASACSLLLATCAEHGVLAVHQEEASLKGIPFTRSAVNRSVPVEIVYEVHTNNLQGYSISWMHNGGPIKVEDNANKEVYYAVHHEEYGLKVLLHISLPTARVTGNWTMTATTAGAEEHVALCRISSPAPIFDHKWGAVRAYEGDPLSVTCELESYPRPSEILWKYYSEGRIWVSVPNATFENRDGVQNAIMHWQDASQHSGFYMCSAHSPGGSDNLVLEVRIKGKLAYVWPSVGIGLELLVLAITIAAYERAQSKRRKAEERRSSTFVM